MYSQGASGRRTVSNLTGVDVRDDIREFLRSRRARLTPEQVGLPDYGVRRVPGLRREEVAVLAGVSAPYYNRLERGDLSGASDSVLHALGKALRLDDAERAHLFDLARASQPPLVSPPQRRAPKKSVRPDLQWAMDAMTGAAAVLMNERGDILASNALGRALYSDLFDAPAGPVNTARYVFLDPRARSRYPDWESVADTTVAMLRAAAGRNPYDRDLSDLVGELSTRSDEFRTRWASHDVRFHDVVSKRFHHPVVGDLELHFTRLAVPNQDELSFAVFSAEPGSHAEEGLRLLGSWAATTTAEAATADGDAQAKPR